MDFDTIALRRKHSGAWRLLSSDNVALTLGFLSRIFIDDNVREIAETDLVIAWTTSCTLSISAWARAPTFPCPS